MKGTRPVQARSLGPHHIGRELMAFGELVEVRICADGIHVYASDGLGLIVAPEFSFRYFIEEQADNCDPAESQEA